MAKRKRTDTELIADVAEKMGWILYWDGGNPNWMTPDKREFYEKDDLPSVDDCLIILSYAGLEMDLRTFVDDINEVTLFRKGERKSCAHEFDKDVPRAILRALLEGKDEGRTLK